MNRRLLGFNKVRNHLTALVAGFSFIALPCAEAQGKGKGKSKGKPSTSQRGKPGKPDKPGKGNKPGKPSTHPGKGVKGKGPNHAIDRDGWKKHPKFRDKDRDSIITFWGTYRDHDKGLPPGLAKNLRRGKSLPPGWAKKVHSGWIIEDDWWRLFDPVPATYLPRGYVLPKNTGLYLYGDRLIRVYIPTRTVIDFFRIPTIRL